MSKKILIVEDDKMLCTIFEMFIKGLNYNLIGISHTGNEAIEVCKKNKPDVILMDIHLEGDLNGIETSKIICDLFDVPIVYVTSDINESIIKLATNKNTYGFLMKPVQETTLGVTIEFAYAKYEFDRGNK
ncbi:MAG: hypothetical protein B6I20_09245 [Bacteroidetes bacterium 4572_117]|nr:MAG: hypothetical protein B6I20_09245 [Bacteroidetes bacterium 4572_117]